MKTLILIVAAVSLTACDESPPEPKAAKQKTADELQWEREDAISKKVVANYRLQRVMDRAAENASAKESAAKATAQADYDAELDAREAKRQAIFEEMDRKREADMREREQERRDRDLLEAVQKLQRGRR